MGHQGDEQVSGEGQELSWAKLKVPRPCRHAMLHDKGNLVANGIKLANQLTLRRASWTI